MSLDRSLKAASALVRHRNVLTRAERLDRLADEEKWTDAKSVFGLPKVGNRKLEMGKASKDDAAGDAAATPAAGAAAGGKTAAAGGKTAAANPGAKGAAAPAAGAKGAAPAAGGKAGAPAAKGGKK